MGTPKLSPESIHPRFKPPPNSNVVLIAEHMTTRRNFSKAVGTMYTKKIWRNIGKNITKNLWLVLLLDCPSGSVSDPAGREPEMIPPMRERRMSMLPCPHHPSQSRRRRKKNLRRRKKRR